MTGARPASRTTEITNWLSGLLRMFIPYRGRLSRIFRVPTTDAYAVDPARQTVARDHVMPVIKSIKDVVVGQAMRLAGSPRVAKFASDPRLMNVAMKALSLGGTLKSGMDRAGGVAAGVLGLATQQEVANLRATIQQLEDTVVHT